MQWLIANMWMALAAATFLGLLFGFSFRGLLVGSRIRRAQVEREIAKTELTQTKAEVEALYAAQRKRKEENAQAVGGDDSLHAELEERETRITSLGDELAAARAELEQLKSEGASDNNVAEMAGAAAAGAVAGAVLSDDDQEELTQLRDRNVWLEERVATLEADMSAAGDAAPAAVAEAPAEDAGTVNEKLKWQAEYLRLRVDALEADAVSSAAVAAPVAAVAAAAIADEPAANDEAAGESDEELARLRWRNRYLEGRLAYYEGDGSDGDEAAADAEASVEDAPAETDAAADETEPEPEPDVEPQPEPETEAETAPAVDAADEDVHPSEAMLAELEGVQPEQISQPDSGGDDLTAITGIGPRIGEVLNELGIWTYAQIAAWTPENETWIENHLSFKGRVSRENWVEQAKSLITE
jgi:predicted flap endonuclease-1-like 5' DNA nuclease